MNTKLEKDFSKEEMGQILSYELKTEWLDRNTWNYYIEFHLKNGDIYKIYCSEDSVFKLHRNEFKGLPFIFTKICIQEGMSTAIIVGVKIENK